MNRKYLLRGIGIGIIIGALIMYAAAATMGGSKADSSTDKAVVATEDKTTEAVTTEEKTTEEKTTEAVTTEEKTTEEKTTEEKTTEEVTTEEKTTEEKTTEEKTTEATTEEKTTEEKTTEEKTTEEKTTEEKTTEATTEKASDDKSGDKVSITVTSGMPSETISKLLEDNGLVDSADDFNAWLIEKGYEDDLHVGTFEIKKGSSFDEIAKLLTTQGQ